jgi:poly-gamma-glutamate synthesis protein (capsule biosynthesis protein)
VHFADQVAALLDEPGTSLAALRPQLAGADIAMVNLETAVTTRGRPAPKTYHFRTSPVALEALAAAGVDVVTMANNHAVDYGRTGLADTLAAQRRSPIPVVGIGPDAAHAYAPAIFTVRGVRVAVLGASQVNDWTLQNWTAGQTSPGIASAVTRSRLVTAVQQARSRADVVVVYLHWGTERFTCPDQAQERTAKALSAAGADIVVGSHAHRVQGAGWLGNTFVGYGLGNFIWYNSSSAGSATTGVLTVTVRGRTVVTSSWTPLRIARSGVPGTPSSSSATAMVRSWRQARGCTGLAATGPRPPD